MSDTSSPSFMAGLGGLWYGARVGRISPVQQEAGMLGVVATLRVKAGMEEPFEAVEAHRAAEVLRLREVE